MGFNRFNQDDDYNNEFENDEQGQNTVRESFREEVSIFSEGLIIEGNVSVESPLVMKGKINGNLFCKQSVELKDNATISGDVHADSLNLESGEIYGDVTISNQMTLRNDTYIKGNIKADTLDINGNVEGNIYAQSEISFSSDAKVQGDVSALYISIEKGAKISGAMNIGEMAKAQEPVVETPVYEEPVVSEEPAVEETVEEAQEQEIEEQNDSLF